MQPAADAERTMHNLYVLGSVSVNDKLMTNDDRFDIYSPTMLRAGMRMWYREHRSQNILRVRQTITQAFQIASKALEDAKMFASSSAMSLHASSTALQFVRTCDALLRGCGGLRTLRQTYLDDAALTSQLDLMVEDIEDFLTLMRQQRLELHGCMPYLDLDDSAVLPSRSLHPP